MPYCGFCGELVPQGSYKFCGHCGRLYVISEQDEQTVPDPSHLKDTPSVAQKFFHGEDDLTEIQQTIRKSEQVILWGYTLSSHIPFLKEEIEIGLDRGLQAKVLLIKPSGIALEMAASRSENRTPKSKLNENLEDNLERLEDIKKGRPKANFEYKVIDYLAPYTMYIYDSHLPSGKLMARLSTFDVPNSERLTYYLTKENEEDLFTIHVNQFTIAWKKAQNWEKSSS